MEPKSATKPPKPQFTAEQIEKFIQSCGGLTFPRVVFRSDPEAVFTTGFGIDTSTEQLRTIRIHPGTDRARGRYGQNYAPFSGTFTIEESSDFGTLFRIRVLDDFEIRIGHMKLEEIAVRSRADAQIQAGELIGLTGSEGKSTGPHTHLEIVSLHGTSEVVEAILAKKSLPATWWSPEELKEKAGPLWDGLVEDLRRKGVTRVGPHRIEKMDPWTKAVQTYYDSRAVFGI